MVVLNLIMSQNLALPPPSVIIEVEKHTSRLIISGENCRLRKPSQKKKGNQYARTKGLYVNRAFGGDCHRCIIDGDIDAGAAASEWKKAFGVKERVNPCSSSVFWHRWVEERNTNSGEVRTMKKIEVKDKTHIKQLLYAECVLGVKDEQYRSFGGFQLWWYDKQRGVCYCCESHWFDPRKKLIHYSLDKAAKILLHNRHCLFVRSKHVSEDKKLETLEHLEDVK